jgi:hypothetical protein
MQVEPAGSKKGFEVIYPLFYLNRHGRLCGPYGAEENVEGAIGPSGRTSRRHYSNSISIFILDLRKKD